MTTQSLQQKGAFKLFFPLFLEKSNLAHPEQAETDPNSGYFGWMNCLVTSQFYGHFKHTELRER